MLTFTSLLMCVYPNKRTMNPTIQTISILDSHTGGEPTRLVLAGGPELGDGPLSERLQRFRTQHDHIRSAIICEPFGRVGRSHVSNRTRTRMQCRIIVF
jgi:proline racemase